MNEKSETYAEADEALWARAYFQMLTCFTKEALVFHQFYNLDHSN